MSIPEVDETPDTTPVFNYSEIEAKPLNFNEFLRASISSAKQDFSSSSSPLSPYHKTKIESPLSLLFSSSIFHSYWRVIISNNNIKNNICG